MTATHTPGPITVGQPRYQVLQEPNRSGHSIRDWQTMDTVVIHRTKRAAVAQCRALEAAETARRAAIAQAEGRQ